MTRSRPIMLAVLAVLTGLAVAAPAFGKATPLAATVGPGFTISVKKAGVRVTTLKRGAYTIAVNDRSDLHNFRLRGPGLNRATGIAFVTRSPTPGRSTARSHAGRFTGTCHPAAVRRGRRGTTPRMPG